MTKRGNATRAPKISFRAWLPATVALGALVAATGNVQAGAFALREQSTLGLGMAFAGAAAGSAGLSSMFWNPATITMHPGWNGQQSFSLVAPYAKIKTTGSAIPAAVGDAGDIGQAALVPSGAASVQLTDRLFLGVVSGAPFGLVTKPDTAWRGELYGRSSRVVSVNVTPTIGYQITNWLAVGAGLQVQYFKTRLNSAIPVTASPLTYPSFGLEGDNTSVGVTAGVTITPMVGTQIGLGYRSTIEHELTGTAGAAFPLTPSTPIKTTIRTPDMLTFGISQVVTDRISLSGGVEWTNWSRFGTFPVYNQTTGAQYTLLGSPVALSFKYKDGWYFSIGGEYKIDPAWTVRAGLGYEISPIRDDTRSVRLPDNDRLWTTIGLSYKWSEQLAFDISYAHIFPKSTKINIVPGNPAYSAAFGPYTASVDSNVNIVSVGLRYHFGEVLQKDKPLIVKY